MWLYTVPDEPIWLEFEDGVDSYERLRVSRDDVRRKGVLGRVPARKPADARADEHCQHDEHATDGNVRDGHI